MGRKAADMRRRLLGLEHPDTYHSISNLAVAIQNGGGDIEEATDLLLEVLASQRVHLGEDHPDVAMIHFNLGSAYAHQDSLDLAERHFSRSFDIRLASLGPAHPRTWYSLNRTAELLEQAGRFDDVAHLHERYLDAVVDAQEVRPNYLFRSEIYLARYRLNRGQADINAAHIEHCVEMARAGRLGVDQMQQTLTVAEELMASGGAPPVVEALPNELKRLMEKDSSESEP